jgi:hypothetical protein
MLSPFLIRALPTVIRLHEGAGAGITKVMDIIGDSLVSVAVAWANRVYVPGSNRSYLAASIPQHPPSVLEPVKAQ